MSTALVERYFDRAVLPDPEPYFAQFAEDAVAEDEGHLYEGIDAIRAWRSSVPPVAYEVRALDPVEGGFRALVDISGDFPGSPVSLGFAFVFRGEVIEHLAIRPVDG
jgi:hypothetical protein